MDYEDFKGYTEYYQDATVIVERSEVIFKGSRTHTKKQNLKVNKIVVNKSQNIIELYVKKGLEYGLKPEYIEKEIGNNLTEVDTYSIVAINEDENVRYNLSSRPTYNHKRNQLNFPASSKIVNTETYLA